MDKKRLIYVSSPYTGAVVEGQVYELLEYIKRTDWFDDVLLLQSYSRSSEKNKAAETLKKFTFRYKFYWQNPNYPFFYYMNIDALKRVMKGEVFENTVFHVRGGTFALFLRKALPSHLSQLIILDEFRGFSSSELDYTKGSNLINRLKNTIRSKHHKYCLSLLQTDKYTCYTAVSPKLREVEASVGGFDINKISVHPNIASTDFVYSTKRREEIRRNIGLSDDQILVVASSGESGAWQKDLDIIDTLVSKGYYVLNLSKKIIDKPNVISRFVPHKEMPAYLSACDAALLWRDDVLLNNVASPSKYSEFAVMGLYVIHNGTVEIAKQFIEENDCGQITTNPNDIHLERAMFNERERQRRCDAGYKVFSIDVIARSYKNILYSK